MRIDPTTSPGELPSEQPDAPAADDVVARLETLWEGDTQPAESRLPVLVPERIGRYQVVRVLGSGSFGIVCLAHDERLGRDVALKIPRPEVLADEERLIRFEAEARAAAALDHPGIIPILEADLDGPLPYIASAYCPGPDLGHWMENAAAPIPIRQAAHLIAQIADAMQHAHDRGVFHRDLKPSNVMLATMESDNATSIQELEGVEPRVTDFGLAKLAERSLCETGSSVLVGTPMYLPPEKLRGDAATFPAAADIYAIGVILYELLSGRPPFEGESYFRIVEQISRVDPPRISTVRPGVSRDLETICLKCLEKEPFRRYATAEAVASDLRNYLANRPIAARRVGPLTRSWRWCQRNRVVAGLSGLIATLLVGAAVGGVVVGIREARLRTEADFQTGRAEVALVAADSAAQDASRQRNEAVRQRNAALLSQYYSDMTSAQADWQAGNLSRSDAKLMAHLPHQDEPDRRGWEWYYLLSLCHPEERSFYHQANVASIAWSPDGKLLASTGYFGSAKIWDTDTGELIREIDESSVMKRGAAWSPDGNRLAWGTTAALNRIFIWDRRDDSIGELNGHTFSLGSVDWHPDGKRLLSASYDDTVKIWDTTSKDCTCTVKFHGNILEAKYNPDASLIAATSYGKQQLHILDVAAEKEIPTTPRQAWRTDWSPDGTRLAVGCNVGWYLLDTETWERTVRSASVFDVRAIAYSPDGKALACGGSDGVVQIVDPDSGETYHTLRAHQGTTTAIAWHPNGQRIATAGADGRVKLWRLDRIDQPRIILTPATAQRLRWTDDRTIEKVHLRDGDTLTWDSQSSDKLSARWREGTTLACPSLDGQWLAEVEATGEQTTKNVVISNSHRQTSFVAETGFKIIAHFDWSPDNRLLAIGGELVKKSALVNSQDPSTSSRADHELVRPLGIEIWSVAKQRRHWKWQNQMMRRPSWSPDGNHLLVAAIGEPADGGSVYWSPHLYVLDITRRQQIAKFRHRDDRDAFLISACWSPDGQFVAGGDMNGFVEVREWQSGQAVFSTRVHQHEVSCMTWSPDGTRLATTGPDHTVKLLLPSTGQELLSIPLMQEQLQLLAWSPTGRQLAGHSRSRMIHIWDAETGYGFAHSNEYRGHLAEAYLARSTSGTESQRQYDLKLALEHSPATNEYRIFRGNLSAMLGDYQQAAAEFKACPNCGPDTVTLEALTHAAAGDQDRYSASCESLLDRFENTDDMIAASRIVQVCNLLPNDGIDHRRVLRLAEMVEAAEAPGFPGDALVAEAQYRLGAYRLAKDRLVARIASDKLTSEAIDSGLSVRARVFLAMACFQLGDKKHAANSLDHALQLMEKQLLQSERKTWHRRLMQELLAQEATRLIAEGHGF